MEFFVIFSQRLPGLVWNAAKHWRHLRYDPLKIHPKFDVSYNSCIYLLMVISHLRHKTLPLAPIFSISLFLALLFFQSLNLYWVILKLVFLFYPIKINYWQPISFFQISFSGPSRTYLSFQHRSKIKGVNLKWSFFTIINVSIYYLPRYLKKRCQDKLKISVVDPRHFGTDPDPIRGSIPLTYGSGFGSGSCYFRQCPSRWQQKTFFPSFLLFTFWNYIYIMFQR
jgi:hypothetical protein